MCTLYIDFIHVTVVNTIKLNYRKYRRQIGIIEKSRINNRTANQRIPHPENTTMKSQCFSLLPHMHEQLNAIPAPSQPILPTISNASTENNQSSSCQRNMATTNPKLKHAATSNQCQTKENTNQIEEKQISYFFSSKNNQ